MHINKLEQWQAKHDILEAGLDAYEQSHPNKTREEASAIRQLTDEKLHLADLIDSFKKNPQTKTIKEYLDAYLQLGNIEDVSISVDKKNGSRDTIIDGDVRTVRNMLSSEWLNRSAFVVNLDEDDSYAELVTELDERKDNCIRIKEE